MGQYRNFSGNLEQFFSNLGTLRLTDVFYWLADQIPVNERLLFLFSSSQDEFMCQAENENEDQNHGFHYIVLVYSEVNL